MDGPFQAGRFGRPAQMIAKILLGAVFLAAVSCSSTSPSSVPDAKPSPAAAPADPANEQKRQNRIAELKRHFTSTVDEFDKSVTIRHKAFSKYMNGNGTTIEAEIVGDHIFVESQYVAQEWIFHERFIVKVGNDQITGSGKSRHEVVSGVVEVVSLNAGESTPVAEFIAHAGNKPVRVRLEGKFYKDYTLRPIHQKAIAETVEYWHLTTNNQ